MSICEIPVVRSWWKTHWNFQKEIVEREVYWGIVSVHMATFSFAYKNNFHGKFLTSVKLFIIQFKAKYTVLMFFIPVRLAQAVMLLSCILGCAPFESRLWHWLYWQFSWFTLVLSDCLEIGYNCFLLHPFSDLSFINLSSNHK